MTRKTIYLEETNPTLRLGASCNILTGAGNIPINPQPTIGVYSALAKKTDEGHSDIEADEKKPSGHKRKEKKIIINARDYWQLTDKDWGAMFGLDVEKISLGIDANGESSRSIRSHHASVKMVHTQITQTKYQSIKNLSEIILSTEAETKLRGNPFRFIHEYGTHYVHTIHYGGILQVHVKFSDTSAKTNQEKQFKMKAGVNLLNKLGLSGKGGHTSENSADTHEARFHYKLHSAGCLETNGNTDYIPETYSGISDLVKELEKKSAQPNNHDRDSSETDDGSEAQSESDGEKTEVSLINENPPEETVIAYVAAPYADLLKKTPTLENLLKSAVELKNSVFTLELMLENCLAKLEKCPYVLKAQYQKNYDLHKGKVDAIKKQLSSWEKDLSTETLPNKTGDLLNFLNDEIAGLSETYNYCKAFLEKDFSVDELQYGDTFKLATNGPMGPLWFKKNRTNKNLTNRFKRGTKKVVEKLTFNAVTVDQTFHAASTPESSAILACQPSNESQTSNPTVDMLSFRLVCGDKFLRLKNVDRLVATSAKSEQGIWRARIVSSLNLKDVDEKKISTQDGLSIGFLNHADKTGGGDLDSTRHIAAKLTTYNAITGQCPAGMLAPNLVEDNPKAACFWRIIPNDDSSRMIEEQLITNHLNNCAQAEPIRTTRKCDPLEKIRNKRKLPEIPTQRRKTDPQITQYSSDIKSVKTSLPGTPEPTRVTVRKCNGLSKYRQGSSALFSSVTDISSLPETPFHNPQEGKTLTKTLVSNPV